MNKRTRDILYTLMKENSGATVTMLSERWQVSERTIRNDIAELNEYLTAKGAGELATQKDGTVAYTGGSGRVLNLGIEKDLYAYRLSKEERIKIFCYLLISVTPAITLGTLAEVLQVSRATITHDVEEVREQLAGWNLMVSSYSNKGLCVQGREMDKRYALYHILLGIADIFHVNDVRFPDYPGINVNERILPERRKAVCRIINEQEHLQGTFLTDDSFARLQCYLIVAMLRNEDGFLLEQQIPEGSCRMEFARELLQYISRYCELTMSEDEVIALSLFLDGLQYTKKKIDMGIIRTQMVTRRFISVVSRTLQVPLTTDLGFYEDLSNHLASIFKCTVLDTNPSINEITQQYPRVYQAVLEHKYILEEACGRSLRDPELKYIVIHICVAMERLTNLQREPRIVLVCGSGNVTSRFLYEKLSHHLHIGAMFSAHDVEGIESCDADMIISTVPLENSPVDVVLVSAMLTKEDYTRILDKIEELRRRWQGILKEKQSACATPKQLLKQLQKLALQETGSSDSRLYRNITKAVSDYFGMDRREEQAPPLHRLLAKEHIFLNVECDGWREAVKAAAGPLRADGYINSAYVQKIFEIIENKGAYMIMSKGLIVPHAGLDDGTFRMGFSMVRLKEPIDFGEEDYQRKIQFVCCLSPTDATGHLQALMTLTNLFSQEQFSRRMQMAATPEEVQNIICQYEEQEAMVAMQLEA